MEIAQFSAAMVAGFALRISRDQYLRLLILFLRIASLGAALGYAMIAR